jgi:hypothetical protein
MSMEKHSETPSITLNESLTPNTQPPVLPSPQKFKPPEIRGDQRVFLVGKTNSGKSYVARYLLKVARQHGWRIVIIDPKKDWMGRGDERLPFSDGSKKEKGTIDKPVLVNSFRSVLIRTDSTACQLGYQHGKVVYGYHGNRQYDSLYR